MTAMQILHSVAAKNGWDYEEQVVHLCSYIEQIGMCRDFGDYLDDITDDNEHLEEEE